MLRQDYNNLKDKMKAFENKKLSYSQGYDCAAFVSEMLLLTTGKDHRDILKYRSYRQMLKFLKSEGCKTVEDLVTKILKVKPKPATYAKVGDVVSLTNDYNQCALGICMGKRAYFLGDNGYEKHSLINCDFCWSVNE